MWLYVKRKVSAKKNGENSTLYYFIRLYVKIKTGILIVLLNGLVN